MGAEVGSHRSTPDSHYCSLTTRSHSHPAARNSVTYHPHNFLNKPVPIFWNLLLKLGSIVFCLQGKTSGHELTDLTDRYKCTPHTQTQCYIHVVCVCLCASTSNVNTCTYILNPILKHCRWSSLSDCIFSYYFKTPKKCTRHPALKSTILIWPEKSQTDNRMGENGIFRPFSFPSLSCHPFFSCLN